MLFEMCHNCVVEQTVKTMLVWLMAMCPRSFYLKSKANRLSDSLR